MTLKKCNKTSNPKPDTSSNCDGMEEVISKCMNKEKRLYPLRINKTTVIYVTKNKLNERYRQEYLERMDGTKPKANTNPRKITISKEELQCGISEGLTNSQLAKRLSVSTTTIRNKLKEYELI